MQNLKSASTMILRIEPDELPGCSTPRSYYSTGRQHDFEKSPTMSFMMLIGIVIGLTAKPNLIRLRTSESQNLSLNDQWR